MCGVPFHAADAYIARLVRQGHRVAICDQIEDPRFAKNRERGRNRDVLIPLLEELFRSRPAKEWVERIGAAAIPCGQSGMNDLRIVNHPAKCRGIDVGRSTASWGCPINRAHPHVPHPLRLLLPSMKE